MKRDKIPYELPYPIALVIWEDSHTTNEGHIDPATFDADEKRSFFYATVGWIIKDDEKGVVLCKDLRSYDDEIENDLSIIRNAIVDMRYLA